jgi:hypothetical protein
VQEEAMSKKPTSETVHRTIELKDLQSLLTSVMTIAALLAGFVFGGAMAVTHEELEKAQAYIATFLPVYGGNPSDITTSRWSNSTADERQAVVMEFSRSICWDAALGLGFNMTSLTIGLVLYILTLLKRFQVRYNNDENIKDANAMFNCIFLAPLCVMLAFFLAGVILFFKFTIGVLKVKYYIAFLHLDNVGEKMMVAYLVANGLVTLYAMGASVCTLRQTRKVAGAATGKAAAPALANTEA